LPHPVLGRKAVSAGNVVVYCRMSQAKVAETGTGVSMSSIVETCFQPARPVKLLFHALRLEHEKFAVTAVQVIRPARHARMVGWLNAPVLMGIS